MDEFIKRKEVYKAAVEKTNNPACPAFVAANILQSIVDIPAADVGPVRHGYWWVGYFHDRVCSCCCHPDNDLDDYPHPYCPNCGAKMDKKRRTKEIKND